MAFAYPRHQAEVRELVMKKEEALLLSMVDTDAEPMLGIPMVERLVLPKGLLSRLFCSGFPYFSIGTSRAKRGKSKDNPRTSRKQQGKNKENTRTKRREHGEKRKQHIIY